MMHKQLLSIMIILLCSGSASAQTPIDRVETVLADTRIDSMLFFVRELTGDTSTVINTVLDTIKSRHRSRPGNDKAGEYIRAKLESYGLTVSVQPFNSQMISENIILLSGIPYSYRDWDAEPDVGPVIERQITKKFGSPFPSGNADFLYQSEVSAGGKNIIGEQTGTAFPNRKYIICAHYDNQPNSEVAPGADDNASGTAAVIEAARVFSQFDFPFTIVYALFDEEEQGLLGSHYYAQQAALAGDSILGVINIDMISWDSDNDDDIDIHTRSIMNSTQLAQLMARTNSVFSLGLDIQTVNPGSGASDHAAFWSNGYSAIMLIEDFSDFNAYYHTPNDRIDHFNIPYYEKAAKLAFASLALSSLDLNIDIAHTPQEHISTTDDLELASTIVSDIRIGSGAAAPRVYYRTSNGGVYSEFEDVIGVPADTNGTYLFTLPGQPLGTAVQYYIAAQDSVSLFVSTLPSGGSGYSPPGSNPPSEKFLFFVATDSTDLLDDMSSPENWLTIGSWDTTSVKFVSAPSSFTDSPDGNYPDNLLGVATFADTIDLTNVLGATLEFDTQWDIEKGSDYGQVQAKSSLTWTALEGLLTTAGRGPFQPNGKPIYDGNQSTWVTERLDLSEFIGSKINFRFVLRSNDSLTADGWYIDNVVLRTFDLVSVEEIRTDVISGFTLSQNYPNPFNPVTAIEYSLPQSGEVSLIIYSLLGKEVTRLVDDFQSAGEYSITWDASNFASGIYFYRLQSGDFIKTKKIVLIK